MAFQNDPLRISPWNVESLDAFLVYSCPECMTFKKTVNAFVEHATNEHPNCHELMFSLGFFEPEPRVKSEPLDESEPLYENEHLDKNEPAEFENDTIREQVFETQSHQKREPDWMNQLSDEAKKIYQQSKVVKPATHGIANNRNIEQPVTSMELQNETIDISKVKTEQQDEDSNIFSPLMFTFSESNNASASVDRVLNVSEHEPSVVLRTPTVIFFEKLVPAKANIQANLWEDRIEIPSGPKQNIMYVIKNFNKGRTGRYKNPSCDYGPWNVSTHCSQYRIKDNVTPIQLQWMGEREDRDFGIKDNEKVVLKTSRCYLQADKKYIKMVTYVKQCPEDYNSSKDYCAVEYVGTDINGPNTKPHRNSKSGIPYKRNNEYLLEEAKEKIKKGKLSVKEVLSELGDSYKGQTLPSARALHNMKYELQRKKEKKNEQGDLNTDQIKIETDDL